MGILYPGFTGGPSEGSVGDWPKLNPMLESLDIYDGHQSSRLKICEAFNSALSTLQQGQQHGDVGEVARTEALVSRDPGSCFHFDDHGSATLTVSGKSYHAGRFRCRSLIDLMELAPIQASPGLLRFFVLAGSSLVTDIGALQASAPPESLFQVASQFNCLESPGPYLTPVAKYLSDPTQGPRASISCFPGTLLRHYAAPAPQGKHFVQCDPSPQLNLLSQVTLPNVAQVQNGYLQGRCIKDPIAFVRLLKEKFTQLEVGVHQDTQVVLGANWRGSVVGQRSVTQIFTSTLAAGGYGKVELEDHTWQEICRQLLRAAYLGTLLAAVGGRHKRAVLTLIGGGVFGNPVPLIWDSLLWAAKQIQARITEDLTVIVNGRDIAQHLNLKTLTRTAQEFGGDLILCEPSGARFLEG